MDRKAYRILDANFNRAREAFRTLEEFCRFVLDDQELSARVKQLRHRLCSLLSQMDLHRFVIERDAREDVGKDLKVADQKPRTTLYDCFTAAAKRAAEALRVLAEMAQVEASPVAGALEKLRFETYSLEKEIVQRLPRNRFSDVQLYVLIPTAPDRKPSQILDLVSACLDGGADALQLRAKGVPDDLLFQLAEKFVSLCREYECLSIINDRADIAAVTEADGVHLGQHDLPISRARKLFFKPALIGMSTHHEKELHDAIESGADYVGIGSCYPSSTKPNIDVAGIEYIKTALRILEDSSVGHVAIGGITPDNIKPLLEAGVKAIAVSSIVCDAEDPRKVCSKFKSIFASANK